MRVRKNIPNSARKNYGNYGHCTAALLYQLDNEERRQKETQHKQMVEAQRKEKLAQMMKAFSNVFDIEFPEISAVIHETLFHRWISHNFNKEVANANLQIEGKLREIGNLLAIQRWEEIYNDFRCKDGANENG